MGHQTNPSGEGEGVGRPIPLGNLMYSAWRSWPAPNSHNPLLHPHRQLIHFTQSHTYNGVYYPADGCVQPSPCLSLSLDLSTRRSHAKHRAMPPFPVDFCRSLLWGMTSTVLHSITTHRQRLEKKTKLTRVFFGFWFTISRNRLFLMGGSFYSSNSLLRSQGWRKP